MTTSDVGGDGIGYGLGFSVTVAPLLARIVGSAGDTTGVAWLVLCIGWTQQRKRFEILMAQLTPSSKYSLRRELRQLTYQAMIN
jgi:hypothetical protein